MAIVTGAAQGIGRAIALRLAQEGFAVAAWDCDEDTLRIAVAEDGAQIDRSLSPGSLHDFSVDIGLDEEVDLALAQVIDRHGIPKVVVNNAGIMRRRSIVETDAEEFRFVLDVNLIGSYRVLRAAAKLWLEAGVGGAHHQHQQRPRRPGDPRPGCLCRQQSRARIVDPQRGP